MSRSFLSTKVDHTFYRMMVAVDGWEKYGRITAQVTRFSHEETDAKNLFLNNKHRI